MKILSDLKVDKRTIPVKLDNGEVWNKQFYDETVEAISELDKSKKHVSIAEIKEFLRNRNINKGNK